MGFTPLACLVMATRPGSVDPGLLLWLLQHGGVTVDELGEVLEHGSGMKGLSGTTGDMRDVLEARAEGDVDATLAFDAFIHRLRREVGAMATSAGGMDVLVLTGGIGEHSPEVRAAVVDGLAHLGVEAEPDLNREGHDGRDISCPSATVRTVVVQAREDVEIAREAERLVTGTGGAAG